MYRLCYDKKFFVILSQTVTKQMVKISKGLFLNFQYSDSNLISHQAQKWAWEGYYSNFHHLFGISLCWNDKKIWSYPNLYISYTDFSVQTFRWAST